MQCEPAAQIISKLGGLTAVAKAADVTPTSVQRWRLPSEKGGTGGFIPRKYHGALVTLAAAKGVTLPLHAFIDAAAAKAAFEAA